MIWVIAGTKNARELISALAVERLEIIATTATEYGLSLIEQNEMVRVFSGKLDGNGMKTFIGKHDIKLVIDASHPFAVEVSLNALSASRESGIPLVRYERRNPEIAGIKSFDSFAGAAAYLAGTQGNILLTLGSKNLKYFASFSERLYARVLPLKNSLEECGRVGISPDRIIAMRFPFSKNLNKVLYEELKIKFMVTKESGEEGGVKEKIEAAFETGTEVIGVKRPVINFHEVYYNIDEVVNKAGGYINANGAG